MALLPISVKLLLFISDSASAFLLDLKKKKGLRGTKCLRTPRHNSNQSEYVSTYLVSRIGEHWDNQSRLRAQRDVTWWENDYKKNVSYTGVAACPQNYPRKKNLLPNKTSYDWVVRKEKVVMGC